MRDERQDDALGELIASAAKALTVGEPTRSLRSVVRERIGHRRPAWALVPAWGLAAAAVILAVVVGRGLMQPADDDRPAREVVESVPAPKPAPVMAQAPARQAVQSPQPTRRLVAAAAPLPEEEDPLIPPITIAPLSTVQIAVDTSSGVMPIEIEPLQIEPLQGSGQ